MADLESYLDRNNLTIESKADPNAGDLLRMRAELQTRDDLRAVFLLHPKEEWVQRLTELTDGSVTAIQYIVDEYSQIGTSGIQVIDPETGKTLFVLSEEDFYEPGLVPRYGGSMVQRPKQIRPEVEGAIIMFLHDRDRQRHIISVLKERLSTLGLPERALKVATKKGRQDIVREVAQHLQSDLPEAFQRLGGPTKEFVNLVTGPEIDGVIFEGKVATTERLGVQDPLTMNLRFDSRTWLRTSIVAHVVREIAKQFVQECVATSSLRTDIEHTALLWIAPPHAVEVLRKASKASIFVVEGLSKIVAVYSKLGQLTVDDFQVQSVEGFDRWEIRAEASFKLNVDVDAFTCFTFEA